MSNCPNCNKQLADGAQFCDGCGTQLQQANVFCPGCGKQLAAGTPFCDACGTAVNQVAGEQPVVNDNPQSNGYEAPAQQSPVQEILSKLSVIPKKFIHLGIAAIAAVLVLVIILSTVFTPKASNHVLYLKDSQLFYTAVSRIKPFEVTEDLADDISDSSLVSSRGTIGNGTHVTADGKLIFYIDEIDNGGYDLCYRYLGKAKKEPVKIDSNVRSYFVDKSGKKLIYLTDDSKLYQYNLKEKEKVDNDVTGFIVSKDAKKIIYFTDDGDLYIKNGKKDKEKIEGKIDSVEYVSEDLKTVYYVKKDTLYKHKLGKEKEKIDNDIDNVIAVYESGEIYYTKDAENKEITLMDYVNDDKASADSKIEKPEYPSWSDFYYEYDDFDQANEAYEAARDKYEEDYEIWREKYNRDNLRENLEEQTVEAKTATLCYFNGKKTKELTKDYSSYSDYAADEPVLIYSTLDKNAGGKVKLSEIESYWEVKEMVEENLEESGKKCLAVNDKTSELDIDDAGYFEISADGKTVFFMKDVETDEDDDDAEPHGDLYRMKISGKKAKKAEKYDSDVYAYSNGFFKNGSFYYYKDYEDNQGELYIDKKKAGDDVYTVVQMGENKYICLSDYDSGDRNYTLSVFDGKKSKKVADEVFDYYVTAKGQIAYISDYDTDKYEGELFLYKGGKPKKVDDEVMGIVKTHNDEEYSVHYIYGNMTTTEKY